MFGLLRYSDIIQSLMGFPLSVVAFNKTNKDRNTKITIDDTSFLSIHRDQTSITVLSFVVTPPCPTRSPLTGTFVQDFVTEDTSLEAVFIADTEKMGV